MASTISALVWGATLGPQSIWAEIVEAKGTNYLVYLLVNSSEAYTKWEEPVALAAGNALLQLAAGAMMHAAGGWDRMDIEQGVNSVIK